MPVTLPLIITLASLAAAGTLGINACLTQRHALIEEVSQKFATGLHARAISIELLPKTIDADLETHAHNPTAASAINSFRLAWTAPDDQASARLKQR